MDLSKKQLKMYVNLILAEAISKFDKDLTLEEEQSILKAVYDGEDVLASLVFVYNGYRNNIFKVVLGMFE